MAVMKKLADETAVALLKAIKNQAPKASDTKLLNLAQAYSLVFSAEITASLADDGATLGAEGESG
jgi:hypothetical protein